MLAAELSDIRPKTEASFRCARGADRSPRFPSWSTGFSQPGGLVAAVGQ